VVTAQAGGEVSGCLAGFVTQASIHPVRFLICISVANHTYPVAARSESLAIHLLGADQADVASWFGEQSGDRTDKFEGVRWEPGPGGSPVLAECAAWVEGPILARLPAGDHEAFLIEASHGGPGGGDHTGQFTLHAASDFEPGHPA
jgi:flavin reductase (DIM6/NTAB) family NADH-FMN oxidoreductase RutF